MAISHLEAKPVADLTRCMLCNFQASVVVCCFFQNQHFRNFHSGIPSECQTVWIQIKSDVYVGPDLIPNYLQRLSADGTTRQRVKVTEKQRSIASIFCNSFNGRV